MGTYVQVGLIGLIYDISVLTLKVWAGLLERFHKSLLQLSQPLSPARDTLHGRGKVFQQLVYAKSIVQVGHYTCPKCAAARHWLGMCH